MLIENSLEQPTPSEQPDTSEQDARIEALVQERVNQALMNVAPRFQAPPVQAPAPRPSRALQIREALVKDGVPEEALQNYFELTSAILADKEDEVRGQTMAQMKQAFINECFSRTEEALDELGSVIPAVREGGSGLRKELAQKVSRLIGTSSKYADVNEAVIQGQYPSTRRLREAAAEVIDSYCKAAGVSRPSAGVDIRSSKPVQAEDSGDDIESMSKLAQFAYDTTLKYTKDPKKALARAREADRASR